MAFTFHGRAQMAISSENAEILVDGLDKVSEVASFLKLSASTLYAMMGRGQLPFV